MFAAHRELSALEWIELKQTMRAAAIWLLVAALFSVSGWLAVNAAVVVALRSEPLKALAGVAALNLAVTALGVWRVGRLLRRPFFALTRREAARDAGALFKVIS